VERAAESTPTPQQAIKHIIDVYKPVISKLLDATGISVETFVAQVANACRATPKLWQCTPETVLGAALRCAQYGLAPNDVRNQAWIIPYGREATFVLGYGGKMELARRAVPGLKFDGRPVYPNDEFDVDYGSAKPLTHRPAVALKLDRGGDAFAWYVRATFPDGSLQIHVLDKESIEYHRKFSKNADSGMWRDNYDAAALKSVVHDMGRWLPSSAQIVSANASDGAVVDVRNIEDDDIDQPLPAIEAEAAPDSAA